MADVLDPYHKWLGIPPKDQPPNHYRLLGIERFESDPDVIAIAADQRMGLVRTFQLGPHAALSQKILNELAAARVCLLDAEKKRAYDEELRGSLEPPPVPAPPPPVILPPTVHEPPLEPVQPPIISVPPAPLHRRRPIPAWSALAMLIAILGPAIAGAVWLGMNRDRDGHLAAGGRRPALPLSAAPAGPPQDDAPGTEQPADLEVERAVPTLPPTYGLVPADRVQPSSAQPALPEEVRTSDNSPPQKGPSKKTTAKKTKPRRKPPAVLTSPSPSPPTVAADQSAALDPVEQAIARGLACLADHQEDDGGWTFRSLEPNAGTHASRNAATALALLPFLEEPSHRSDERYKELLDRGVAFLTRRMTENGDLRDPEDRKTHGMYVQALGTMVLAKSYQRTKNLDLRRATSVAADFIIRAQNVDGGWRYVPREKTGDTSVTGWQLTALLAAREAGIRVSQTPLDMSGRFLFRVRADDGSSYAYDVSSTGKTNHAMSAVGLLFRKQLGPKATTPGWTHGVEQIHRLGPSDDVYFNYYATRLLRLAGGPMWEDWKTRVRQKLVPIQGSGGSPTGSWFLDGPYVGREAGRLGCTSFCLMTLQETM